MVQVPLHERHRQKVDSVITFASVSRTFPLQNGHSAGRSTAEPVLGDMLVIVPDETRATLFCFVQSAPMTIVPVGLDLWIVQDEEEIGEREGPREQLCAALEQIRGNMMSPSRENNDLCAECCPSRLHVPNPGPRRLVIAASIDDNRAATRGERRVVRNSPKDRRMGGGSRSSKLAWMRLLPRPADDQNSAKRIHDSML